MISLTFPTTYSLVFLAAGLVVAAALCLFSYVFVQETTRQHANIKLAKDLKDAGWTLYVSMQTCFFCKVQEMLFGQGAFSLLDIVDCDASPEMRQMCQAHPVCSQGTPCWYNQHTGATMIGLQRDFKRLEQAVTDKR